MSGDGGGFGVRWRDVAPEAGWFDPFFEPMFALASAHLGRMASTGAKILHLGCGSGDKTEALRRMGFVATGVDVDEPLLELATRKYPGCAFVRASAEALPFEGGSFDAAFSFSVLQLVDHERVMSECHRVLRPGGCAVFIENLHGSPLALGYRFMHRVLGSSYRQNETPRSYVRWTTRSDLVSLFREASFAAFHLTTPLGLVLPTLGQHFFHIPIHARSGPLHRLMSRLDQSLFERAPPTRKLAWGLVACLIK